MTAQQKTSNNGQNTKMMTMRIWLIYFFSVVVVYGSPQEQHEYKKPHIIVIIADDMGWNDASFHGSSQIPTPNIDALGYNGVILDRFYTQSICTPSRTAFLTGNYPIRSGLQGFPIKTGENRSLPMDMPTMPEHLKKLGYKTHLVGKWHLGAAYRKNTPTERGFDTHFGYWNGFTGYFDYIAMQEMSGDSIMEGLDIFDVFKPMWSAQGKYATELFTEKAIEVIDKHNKDEPLFLVLAHLAGHTGRDGVELAVPNITETNRKFSYIEDLNRRRYADIISIMDDSVGRVVERLSNKTMLENSIILFFSDNGAQTLGLYHNYGSNWPLRGLKFTEFEGGVRGTATLFSPLLKKKGYVNRELIHITDWLPTFYRLAGGHENDLGKIDGIDQWAVLSDNLPTYRDEILVNINEINGYSAIITNGGKYKLVNGTLPSDLDIVYEQYYGEDGRGPEIPEYNMTQVLHSRTNLVIKDNLQAEKIASLRAQLDLSNCRPKNLTSNLTCSPQPCLFDLQLDPCETQNIINDKPQIAEMLLLRLEELLLELVPQTNRPADPKSNPIYYNNTWCTWLDDNACYKTPNLTNLVR